MSLPHFVYEITLQSLRHCFCNLQPTSWKRWNWVPPVDGVRPVRGAAKQYIAYADEAMDLNPADARHNLSTADQDAGLSKSGRLYGALLEAIFVACSCF